MSRLEARPPLAVTRLAARTFRPVSSAAARIWRPFGALVARMPLRVKLISAVLALVAVALAVVGVASVSAIRGYLLNQADQQLLSYRQTVFREAKAAAIGGVCIGRPTPKQYWAELLSSEGKQVTLRCVSTQLPGKPPAAPTVPTDSAWLTNHDDQPVTVPANSGGGQWRVITVRVLYNTEGQAGGPAETKPGTLVVGRDLSDVYQTTNRLTAIDAGVSAVTLLILAGVGVALVRASLRPLTEIERTAGSIAAGHLSLRVRDQDPRTEVGSLASSLNTMLTQIENAFRARAASEASARQSEDRMRRFVADASHELRTPLTSIRGYAEYYRQRGRESAGVESGRLDDEELDQLMGRVEEAAARMGVLVEDLLLLARMDQQRPLDRTPVDMLALAAEAVQDARVIAPDRDIDLTVGSGPAFLVLGDEVRLRQIIGNLMSNALTHTPAGTPVEIRVRAGSLPPAPTGGAPAAPGPLTVPGQPPAPGPLTAPGEPPAPGQPAAAGMPPTAGTYAGTLRVADPPHATGTASAPSPKPAPDAVIIEVADHGPGLSPQQAERVFERFYRADAARGTSTGGTGLGLAIVWALTTAHGGTAAVDTTPGNGATFRITLPLAPEAADFED